MKKVFLYFIFILLCASGATLKFSSTHEQMPIGCDEFGYLNMAKAFDQDVVFSEHVKRPWLTGLLDTLRNNGITENEIVWMITPHAYHLIPGTNTLINQYPPGTSWLLSVVPLTYREWLFPFVCIVLIIIIPLMAIRKNTSGNFTWFDVALALFVFILMVSPPFTKELGRINSLLYTFGFLLAAGILLKKNPFVACFLIALTINFRVVNALILLPVILFMPIRNPLNFSNLPSNTKIAFKCFALCLVATIPLLLYNYLLLGNPFAITYSSVDKAMSTQQVIFENMAFYFSLHQPWLVFHIIILSVLAIMVFMRRMMGSDLLKLAAFVVLNYVFFIFHAVRIDYYPYASAVIMAGFVFGLLADFQVTKFRWVVPSFMIVIGLLIFFTGYAKYSKKDHLTFNEAQNVYKPLCDYSIIWADMYSGTTEYVCNNNGFRFGPSTPRARKMTMAYLSQHGYSQAILQDENAVEAKVIFDELKEANIPYTIKEKPVIGKIIVLH